MLDRVTQRSRGFGFVHFDNKEDMDEAIEKLHDTEIDGRKISVTRAIPQDSIQPGTPAAALGKRERYAYFVPIIFYQNRLMYFGLPGRAVLIAMKIKSLRCLDNLT